MDKAFIPLVFTKKILDYIFVENCPLRSDFLTRISKKNITYILAQTEIFDKELLSEMH